MEALIQQPQENQNLQARCTALWFKSNADSGHPRGSGPEGRGGAEGGKAAARGKGPKGWAKQRVSEPPQAGERSTPKQGHLSVESGGGWLDPSDVVILTLLYLPPRNVKQESS